MHLPDVIITNFKRRITGVTTTALRVAHEQNKLQTFTVGLCGPNQKLNLFKVLLNGWRRPAHSKQRIWHVRRNNEMMWGLFARDILRQPVKLVFTSAAIRRHSPLPRWLISRMDALIATSDLAASFVHNVKAVVGHGVDLSSFKANPNRSMDKIRLICVGRIRPEKGTDLIVDALCDVLPSHPTVTMQFIGLVKSSDKSFHQDQVSKLENARVSTQVDWLGEVAPSQMPELMANSHVLIAAPTYEGFGLTPFEALACGAAVICTNTGAFAFATGVLEQPEDWQRAEVKRGSSGLLINVGDKAALVKALTLLLDDHALMRTFSAMGVKRAASEFSINNEARAIDKVYQQLLGLV